MKLFATAVFGAALLLSAARGLRLPRRVLFLSALLWTVAVLFWAQWRESALLPLPPILRHYGFLTAHVLSLVLAYGAFGFACGVAHRLLWRRWRGVEEARWKASLPLLLRSLRWGVALLGLGIVLGAFWACQAWGRFWGWDPKETAALATLLACVALLHLRRRGGWWGGAGLAAGTLVVFQALLFTWLGVDLLLQSGGLHSYGASGGGGWGWRVAGLLGFAFAEGAFLALTLAFARRAPAPQD